MVIGLVNFICVYNVNCYHVNKRWYHSALYYSVLSNTDISFTSDISIFDVRFYFAYVHINAAEAM